MQTTIHHDDGTSTPVWIVYMNHAECEDLNDAEGLRETSGDTLYTPGYYWAVCFPGCLPDSDFSGPYSSEEVALAEAEESLSY